MTSRVPYYKYNLGVKCQGKCPGYGWGGVAGIDGIYSSEIWCIKLSPG